MATKFGFDIIQKTVTTAGTIVRLAQEEKRVKAMNVIAFGTNSGDIYLGSARVSSTKCIILGSSRNFIWALDDDSDKYFDLSDWYIDASANTQKVMVFYVPYRE